MRMTSKLTVKDLGMKDILKAFKAAGNQAITVGIYPEDRYPDGTLVADIATAHEYGLGVPQRAFMAKLFDATSQATSNIAKEVGKLKDPSKVHRALASGADKLKKEYTTSFGSLDLPPILPSTAEDKGSTQVLRDTGRLQSSIKARVEELSNDPG